MKAHSRTKIGIGVAWALVAAACAAPLDSKFVALVGQTTAWRSIDEGLELRSEAGILRLREGTAAN